MVVRSRKLFYSLFINDLISDFGDTVYYLALMNYVLLLPNSNLALSIITISETIPLLTKVIIGHLADKIHSKVDVIITTQLIRLLLYIFIGIVISFTPALWIVIVISVLNVLSDIVGQLENSLYIPIEMQLIDEEEREHLFASTQSISSTFNIIFKLSGASLVTWISYQTLAFVNAFTFLLCAVVTLLLRSKIRQIVKEDSISAHSQDESFITSLRSSIQTIKKQPSLKEFLIAISVINGLFSIVTPLIVSTIAQNKNFIFINSATTISLSSVFIATSSILGNILATTLLRNVSLRYLIQGATICLPLLFLAFIHQEVWGCYLLLILLGILSGNITPKFYGFLMNNLPVEKVGILTGGIGIIIQLGLMISQLSFSFLIIYVNAITVSYIYLILSICLCLLLLKHHFKTRGEK